jgi:hypothetical protein
MTIQASRGDYSSFDLGKSALNEFSDENSLLEKVNDKNKQVKFNTSITGGKIASNLASLVKSIGRGLDFGATKVAAFVVGASGLFGVSLGVFAFQVCTLGYFTLLEVCDLDDLLEPDTTGGDDGINSKWGPSNMFLTGMAYVSAGCEHIVDHLDY